MGADKAFIEIDGSSLVEIAVRALGSAESVTVVGGDEAKIRHLGHRFLPDREPDAGPLAALETALESASVPYAMVLACDLPRITDRSIAQVVAGLLTATCSVPMVRGRMQWLAAAWAVAPTLDACARARQRGHRSVHEMARGLARSVILPARDHWFEDVDTAEELTRELQRRVGTGE